MALILTLPQILPSATKGGQSAVKGLLKTDILTKTAAGYKVYDYFFADWLTTGY